MSRPDKSRSRAISVQGYMWGLAAIWTMILAASLAWSVQQQGQATREVARTQARTAYAKDITYRRWNAEYGGVYMPVSEEIQPNPHLASLPERDITTLTGKQLTLINPAYMTRLVHELEKRENNILGHITSLKPIRLENAADPWETEALQAFETGKEEVSLITEIGGETYMRLMRPLFTEETCLKCHAAQGYKAGDIRGGIGVSIPMKPLLAISRRHMYSMLLTHTMLWVMGLVVIGAGSRQIRRRIGERNKAERALRQSEARLRRVVTDAPVPIMIHAEDGEVLDISKAWATLSGYSHGDIPTIADWTEKAYGQRTEDIREIINDIFKRDIAAGDGEYTILAKSGASRIWDFISAPLGQLPDGRRLVLSMATDITDRKRAQDERENLIDDLEQKNVEMERFNYTISHDLKSPLITIKGFTSLLEKELTKEKKLDAAFGAMGHINTAIDKMRLLLDDLLALSRVGHVENLAEEFSLRELTDEVMELMSGPLAERKVILEIDDELPIISADRIRIFQVMQNLIENGIKFMGPEPEPVIRIGSREEGGETIIFVRDNGIGILPEFHQRIFDLFQQLHPSKNGSGVGLTMVKRIIELNSGRIWVESEGLEQGSMFCFTLPTVGTAILAEET